MPEKGDPVQEAAERARAEQMFEGDDSLQDSQQLEQGRQEAF